ncbi:MAG: hypothetical protein HGB17_18835 [Syntrophobacteraceae bacterium]|nr:hypothetical protein [Syntrophobacteraceae bacterium]
MEVLFMGMRRKMGLKTRHRRGGYRKTVSLVLVGSLLLLTGLLPHTHHGPAHGWNDVQPGDGFRLGPIHALTKGFEHGSGDSCLACAFLNALRAMELPALSGLATDGHPLARHIPAWLVLYTGCIATHFRVRAPPFFLA